jgi:hypothetical protein
MGIGVGGEFDAGVPKLLLNLELMILGEPRPIAHGSRRVAESLGFPKLRRRAEDFNNLIFFKGLDSVSH